MLQNLAPPNNKVRIVRRNEAHLIPGGNNPNVYMSWAYMHLSPYTKRKICYTPYISNKTDITFICDLKNASNVNYYAYEGTTYRQFSKKDTSSTEQKLCPLIPKTIENIRHG